MDNMCIFTNWVLKGEIKFDSIGNGNKKASFALSAPRPNKAGVWNKNYFVAFGSTAELLEKCNIQSGAVLTVFCEQQVYVKQENMLHNYLVENFQLLPKSKLDAKESPQVQNKQSQENVQKASAPIQATNGNLQGYNEMMTWMNS